MKKVKLIFLICFLLNNCLQANLKIDLVNKINSGKIPDWMKNQIDNDLKYYKKRNVNIDKNLLDWFDKSFAVRYKFKNGKLEIILPKILLNESFSDQANYNLRMENFNKTMNILTQTIRMPDVDFIVYLDDCFYGNSQDLPGPVFGPAKDKYLDKKVILIPDFHVSKYYPETVFQVKLGNKKWQWKKKKNIAFWIGATTGGLWTKYNYKLMPRYKVIEYSEKYPKLIYARFSQLVQMDDLLKLDLEKHLSKAVIIPDHMRYKYLILVNGNGIAYPRSYWQMFSNSLALKQESSSVMWFSGALKPYEHYVPLNNNIDDLIEKINWAKKNDKTCHDIVKNANKFANQNLKLVDNLYYIYLLLNEFSKLQNDKL